MHQSKKDFEDLGIDALGSLREADPEWAFEVAHELYHSVVCRSDQKRAQGDDATILVSMAESKNEIDPEDVRHAARRVLGSVPEPVSNAAVADGNHELINRIMITASMLAHSHAMDAETTGASAGPARVRIRVTRSAISLCSVYYPLS